MSINHYPSDFSSQTHLWPHYYMMMHQSPENNSSSSNSYYTNLPSTTTPTPAAAIFRHPNTFNLNNEETEEIEILKEPLFEKPLTPSDVGKLNRLVIPKQHAERYFPLNGSGGGDCNEKGLLLSFEDEAGKSWRFRYSYWNSSQSYVLTKGWSRFVKEKKLDAGDIVLFFRHRGDAGRLFIGWRRRSATGGQESGGRWNRSSSVYPYPKQNQGGSMIIQQQSDHHHHHNHQCLNAGSILQNQTITAGGTPKRLRLFGVNLECQVVDESEPSTPEGSPMSSQGEPHHQYYPYYHQHHSNNYSHVDINFSRGGGDVYRQ